MLQVIVVKIMDGTEKGLVGQTDKAYENTRPLKPTVILYCISAGTLWKIFESIMCY